MYSKAKIFGHPIHTFLIPFPIAFNVATFVGLCIYQFAGHDAFWFRLSYVANIAAVATAFIAAIPGIIDYVAGIPRGTVAKKKGAIHGGLNSLSLVLFITNIFVLRGEANDGLDNALLSVFITGAGVILTMAAGFFGGELLVKHKVGVDLTPEQERLEPVTYDPITGRHVGSTGSDHSSYKNVRNL